MCESNSSLQRPQPQAPQPIIKDGVDGKKFIQREICYAAKNYLHNNPSMRTKYTDEEQKYISKQLANTASCLFYTHEVGFLNGISVDGTRTGTVTANMIMCGSMFCPCCFNRQSSKQKKWINGLDHHLSKPDIHPATQDVMRGAKRAIMLTIGVGGRGETLRRDLTLDDQLKMLNKQHDSVLNKESSSVVKELIKLNTGATSRASLMRFSSLEILCSSKTGWHPHYHCVVWIDANANTEELQRKLTKMCKRLVHKAGYNLAEGDTGSLISDIGANADYGCKASKGWTIGDEMSGQGGKKSDALTINQLFTTGFRDTNNANHSDKFKAFCRNRSIEYMAVMRKRHLFTRSKGLSEVFLDGLSKEHQDHLASQPVEEGEQPRPIFTIEPIAALKQGELNSTVCKDKETRDLINGSYVDGGVIECRALIVGHLVVDGVLSDECEHVDKWMSKQEALTTDKAAPNTLIATEDGEDITVSQGRAFIDGDLLRTVTGSSRDAVEGSRTSVMKAVMDEARSNYTPTPNPELESEELKNIEW